MKKHHFNFNVFSLLLYVLYLYITMRERANMFLFFFKPLLIEIMFYLIFYFRINQSINESKKLVQVLDYLNTCKRKPFRCLTKIWTSFPYVSISKLFFKIVFTIPELKLKLKK